MKLKSEKIWRRSHAPHGEFGHKFARVWPQRLSSGCASEQDDAFGVRGDVCPYSIALWKILNDATKRCTSVCMDIKLMEGQPCIEGTRIPVRSVLRAMELYGSIEGALRCYPNLSTEQVKDALYFSQVLLELPSGFNETTAVD